jgi:signal transduction histidine kinase
MSKKVKFLTTFRARLMLLLTSFLVLTFIVVFLLDGWANRRADEVIEVQNRQIREAVNSGYGDIARAITIAIQSLTSEKFLYEEISRNELPQTIENIVITNREGHVKDSTYPDLIGQFIALPDRETPQDRAEDPVMHEYEDHPDLPRTYFHPITTTKGLHWIIIVTAQQPIVKEIEQASKTLSDKKRELSNYRLAATTGLLLLALAVVVAVGWRFSRPIDELARAARRVADGQYDFRIDIRRPDEVGQLASTFNDMIAGLKVKHELEEKLNQAERAAVIGRLTQAVAHEVRNPLNVINLSIDHVSSKYAPEDERKREQFTAILSSIKDEIARLKFLVSDLLNFGRPSQMAFKPLDVRELVDETVTLVRAQADAQGIKIAVEYTEQKTEVMGDRERLKSCLTNIVINALQAMPQGGNLAANLHRTDGWVEIKITDTGVGISDEAIQKIFDPYFSTRVSGFGLGLAVTRSIIEDHRGSINVNSRLGHGTTFVVKLPVATELQKSEIREALN